MSIPTRKYWTTEPGGYVDPALRLSNRSKRADISIKYDENQWDQKGDGDIKVDDSSEEKTPEPQWAHDEHPPQTIPNVFEWTVRTYGNNIAMSRRKSNNDDAVVTYEWQTWTWEQYWEDCNAFAKALISLEISPFGLINIIGSNSPEWLIAYNGAILAGCIPAGVNVNSTPAFCQFVTAFERAEVVVVQGGIQLVKYTQELVSFPSLKAVVVWDDAEYKHLIAFHRFNSLPQILSWREFIDIGRIKSSPVSPRSPSSTPTEKIPVPANLEAQLHERQNSIRPGHCACIIHTSGTTGPPKAVMLSHDNVTWMVKSVLPYYHMDDKDRVLSYLPLSHVAAQMIDIHLMMRIGGTVFFASPADIKSSIVQILRQVQPTLFLGVPRVWEKLAAKLKEVEEQRYRKIGVKSWLLRWAKGVGEQYTEAMQHQKGRVKHDKGKAHGKSSKPLPQVEQGLGYRTAKYLVFNGIRNKLGLKEAKTLIVGAAPMDPEVLRYLASFGMPVYELFGLSECSGPHTISFPNAWKIGTCGRPLHGTQSRVDLATGELLLRGRHLFMGYLYNATATAASIDSSGYFRSGDIVQFDSDEESDDECIAQLEKENEKADKRGGWPLDHTSSHWRGPTGFLTIVGRTKELLITAGGENISPSLVEKEMLTVMPALSHCIVIGDRRQYLSMLVVLKAKFHQEHSDSAQKESPGAQAKPTASSILLEEEVQRIGKEIGATAKTYLEAQQDPAWARYIDDGMKTANESSLSTPQHVRKWVWLPVPLSEQDGDINALGKLRRPAIMLKYASLIDSIYEGK